MIERKSKGARDVLHALLFSDVMGTSGTQTHMPSTAANEQDTTM
jgi:hypothetical protein